ncbi:hypothetical protein BGZ72_010469 [Mortierella alpina]|nr:hypothetical protein BGZ72_010469 [Mortierella alpina]
MQSPATISPSSFAPSTPRGSRVNNRSRQNDTRSAPRNTEHNAHSRHQSMPPQQRAAAPNKSDSNNVTILKRSSAAPASAPAPAPAQKGSAASVRTLNADAAVHKHQPQQRQQQQQQQQRHHQNQSQKPRPQSQQHSSKARRVQRRREIDSVTESLANVDLDMAHQSPPLNPSSPPSSSSDSDDSESALSHSPNHFLSARAPRQLNQALPQRPSSAPSVAQLRNGRLHDNGLSRSGIQSQGYHPAGRAAHPMEIMQRPGASAYKASSADRVLLADRVPAEKKSALYAGPTFHNSPAPTSLPIPAFARSAGNSPVEPSVEQLPLPALVFAEAASPQLNSMRPQMPVQNTTQHWHAHHSVPVGFGYNVPERMATSSFTPHEAGKHGVDQLMEISQNLRTLLKIQSQ